MTRYLRSGAGGGAPRGLTLIELLVSIAVLGVLAGVAMPLVQISVTRAREMDLRRALRQTRDGLDRFKAEYDKARTNAKDALADFKKIVSVDRSGYPLTLDEMVTLKVLRRVPKDPMTPDGKWITRSYSDNPESSMTDSKDVFDVRSANRAVGLDGTTYDTW